MYLSGAIGSGKTTGLRGFLRGLGYTEFAKSSSYTLRDL
ncbi:hypothetical protein B1F76_02535 [Coxiella-like endosymbiont of Amblyomma americanum]|nr:hypothetical protein B1F76_02535 [Coxiella-like endosymbiont of Amblyomma americanum]